MKGVDWWRFELFELKMSRTVFVIGSIWRSIICFCYSLGEMYCYDICHFLSLPFLLQCMAGEVSF